MSSLTVHLRVPADHSGLPFHPSCPVCRQERLAGSLGDDAIVSRRTQAVIAAGLLAFSGVGAPAAAVAAGPDLQIDGSDEVAIPDPPEPDLDDTRPVWTDGGEALPEAEEPALAPEAEEPAPAPEAEDGSIEGAASEPVEESLGEAAVQEQATEMNPEPEPIAIAAPPAEEPGATTETPEPSAADGVRLDAAERTKREPSVKPPQPAMQRGVAAAPAPSVAPIATTSPTVRVAAETRHGTVARASSGNRIHVVQRGESLWSIASDLLRDDGSVAEIGGEVRRLWELNAERIGTGSPDLLFAGTRLRLR